MQGLLSSRREDGARREQLTCGALEAGLPRLPCRSCRGVKQPAIRLVIPSDVSCRACSLAESV